MSARDPLWYQHKSSSSRCRDRAGNDRGGSSGSSGRTSRCSRGRCSALAGGVLVVVLQL